MKNWPRWSAPVVLILALAALYHRLLVGDVIFWGLPLLQFYPWETAAFASVRGGSLPLWNPMVGHGAPLLANYQSAVLYPPNWLYFVIPAEYGMGLLSAAHLLWAGAGMRAYLRRVGIGLLGQGLGVVAFVLSGYLIGRFGVLTMVAAAAWLPWLMWAVDGIVEADIESRTRWRRVALLGGITAMQLLAGHAQTVFYSMFMVAAYSLWRVISGPGGGRIGRIAVVVLGVALGAAVAAAQLLPTAELMLVSQRAGGINPEAGLDYSFWPWRFLTLIAPNLFGSPAAGNFDGYGAYWEDAVYIGLLPLVMAGHGLARWLRERLAGEVSGAARVVPFFAASLPVVILFALGKNSQVFLWLFNHNVPGFVTFQAPTRWMLLAEFSLCTMAAVGVDAWKSSERGLFWTRLLTAGGASFIVASLLALHYAGDLVRSGFVPAMAWLGGTIIVVGGVSLLLPQIEERPAWRPWWEIAVLVVVAADLAASHWGLSPTLTADYYHQGSALAEAVRPLTQDARSIYLPEDEYAVKFEKYLDFKDFHSGDRAYWDNLRGSLLPNLGMLDGIPSANNFDPLLPAGQSSLVAEAGEMSPAEMVEALRRMNVGVLLTTTDRKDLADLTAIAESGSVIAYQVPDPWPRASVARCAGEGDALVCSPVGEGQATITSESDMRVEVSTSSDSPATLLLIDTYYPGWIATVDGVPVDLRRANVAFRAVEVPGGSHRVVFSYAPASLRIGAAISGAGLLAIVGLFFWTRGAAQGTATASRG